MFYITAVGLGVLALAAFVVPLPGQSPVAVIDVAEFPLPAVPQTAEE